jgi:hypothetical protein
MRCETFPADFAFGQMRQYDATTACAERLFAERGEHIGIQVLSCSQCHSACEQFRLVHNLLSNQINIWKQMPAYI